MASKSAKKLTPKRGKMQVYNAEGSKAVEAAEDEADDFKKGGVAKKKKDHEKLKHGGHAEGMEMKHRADKKSRGGHAHRKPDGEFKHGGKTHEMHKRAEGGRTPYSSGHKTSMGAAAGETNSGHEGQRPADGGD